jgi:hypothetical protein
LFGDGGVLMSHDGRHLTPPGARLLAARLVARGQLAAAGAH